MAKWWARSAYLVFVCAVVAVGLEVLLRLFFSDPEYYWNDRFLFVSPAAIENRANGVWTYRPHTAIRETAVYALPTLTSLGPRFEVEYDCHMRSNNLGLLQTADIEPAVSTTVIVGDSFTAGQGGCPWFDRLQALRPGEQLLNAGLMGTGVEQWRRLVVHLREQGVNIHKVLAIAISNDFKRAVWNWRAEDLACLNGGACPPDQHAASWLPVSGDETRTQLIERSAVRFSERNPNESIGAGLWRFMRYYSYLFKFGDHANESLKEMIRGACKNCIDTLQLENESGLKGLKELGVPFHVVLVPQRNETGLWWQQPDTDAAMAILDRHGVAYSRCPLTTADFLPIDGHPTKNGYDKIVACAHDVLGPAGDTRTAHW